MLVDLVIFLCYMSILFFYSIIVITIAFVIQLIFYRVFKINLYKKSLKKMRWYYERINSRTTKFIVWMSDN